MTKETLKKQVESVLQLKPETRNCDITLMIEVWGRFYSGQLTVGYLGERYVRIKSLFDLPREDHVKRIRAHFQNDKGLYLPTNWEVARKRKWSRADWEKKLAGWKQPNMFGGSK